MELDTNNHSVFLLSYQLLLVTKYRRQVIDDELSRFAKNIFERISESYYITLPVVLVDFRNVEKSILTFIRSVLLL